MSSLFMRLFISILAMSVCTIFTGCDDSSSGNTIRRSRKKKKRRKPVVTKATDQLTGVPKKLQNVDWTTGDDLAGTIRESRDPFLPFVDDLKVKAEEEEKKQITKIKTAVGSAQVGDLKLVAIITGTALHKAMVEDGRGVGHIVRAGDVVGGTPPMRIVRITRNEVIFRALEKGPDEKVPSEIRKTLLTKEELQERGR